MKPTDWLGLSLAVASGVILVMVTLNTPVPASDLPGYLAMARDGVLDVDVGTWAEGREFVNGSWLYQRAAWELFQLGGWELLVALNALAVAGALVLVGRVGWERGRGVGAGVAVLIASLLMMQNTAMRPQTAAFLLAALVLWAPRTWHVGVLTILWANVHGSFVLAPALAGIRARDPWRVGVAALAWLANPFGWELLSYVFDNSSLPAERGLDEWSATPLLSPIGLRLFCALAVGLGLAIKRRPPVFEVIVAGVLAVLALTAVRHVAWLGLVLGPLVAGWLPRAPAGQSRFARVVFLAVAAVALCGIVRFLPWLRAPPTSRAEDAWLEPQAPVEVLSALDQLDPGEVLVPFAVGGLVRWRHPRWRVPVDVRVWLYSDAEWAAYERTRSSPAALVLVDRHRESGLDRHTGHWVVLAEDGRWSLRSPPEEVPVPEVPLPDEPLPAELLERLDDLDDIRGLAAPTPP